MNHSRLFCWDLIFFQFLDTLRVFSLEMTSKNGGYGVAVSTEPCGGFSEGSIPSSHPNYYYRARKYNLRRNIKQIPNANGRY